MRNKERKMKSLKEALDLDFKEIQEDDSTKIRPLSSFNGKYDLSHSEIKSLISKGELDGFQAGNQWFTTEAALERHRNTKS